MNRRGHGFVVRSQLAQGRIGWLLRASARALALRLGRPGGLLFGTLAVTWKCNYRCAFCDLPERARGDPPLAALIARLALLERRGALAVGITGGEPLLHPQLFELLAEGRRRGLLLHLNTNGSRLTGERVEALLAAGLHSINVSLDGAQPATHDALRGVAGSFAQIGATVAALRRGRRGATPRLGLVMAVSRANFREVAGFVATAREWQVDAAGFLPHHDFVAPGFRGATTEAARTQLTVEEAAELAAALDEAAGADAGDGTGPRLDNSPGYRRGIAPFLAGAEMPVACSAPRSHLALDPDGVGYPCVPLMTLRRAGVAFEDLEQEPRRAPQPSPADREEVCRRCWWNCHRELDLTLRKIPAPAASAGRPGSSR